MARRALGPATLRLVQAVSAALDDLGRDDHRHVPQEVIVAVSGGPDSLALAAAAAHVTSRRGLPIAAVIVDHGLQPGSAEVAERAAGQLKQLGIDEVTIARAEIGSSGLGPEAEARTARYRILAAEAERRDAVILLGHTLDDQAETVLLGLARGSGIRSLAGMSAHQGRYLRPLLGIRRELTIQTCAELGLEPWHDPHNGDPAYSRSRLRHRVMPVLEAELGPQIVEALARTAHLAHADADLLDQLAAEAVDPSSESLDCRRLAALTEPLRRRVIKNWLRARGSAQASFNQVVAVDALVTDWHGQQQIFVPGLAVRRESGRLWTTPPI